jgi:hypothetical protein
MGARVRAHSEKRGLAKPALEVYTVIVLGAGFNDTDSRTRRLDLPLLSAHASACRLLDGPTLRLQTELSPPDGNGACADLDVSTVGERHHAHPKDLTMAFTERSIDGITILDLSSHLTEVSGAEMWRRIRGLAAAGDTRVILNLADVSVDSSGLGTMVGSFVAMRRVGVETAWSDQTHPTDAHGDGAEHGDAVVRQRSACSGSGECRRCVNALSRGNPLPADQGTVRLKRHRETNSSTLYDRMSMAASWRVGPRFEAEIRGGFAMQYRRVSGFFVAAALFISTMSTAIAKQTPTQQPSTPQAQAQAQAQPQPPPPPQAS